MSESKLKDIYIEINHVKFILPIKDSEIMVILFQFKNEGISIQIEAKFDNGDLVIEGYDIGRTVKEYWGDSDYE